ncbi:hypothetical protein MYX77_09205, partial [Acidobacteriia bacterium AH_259_A11_L15]|nr:hypothetical protein [Acidobacteriia bacterium AH_259_A11_L15]
MSFELAERTLAAKRLVMYGEAVQGAGVGGRPVVVDDPQRIDNGNAANLAPDFWIRSDGGSGAIFYSGQLWLKKGDSNQRRTALAAPTGETAATTADTGTLAAGHYRFKVTAFNDVGESLPSTATTDLVITANQVIEVIWNRVSGARGYRVYAAFNASADPGTANTSYWAQEPQTGGGVILRRLQNEDELGGGVGTEDAEAGAEAASLAAGIVGGQGRPG